MTIFENAQWKVLDDGVESKDGFPPYDFAIDRVFETTTRGTKMFYDWPVHMAEKTWVDLPLFNEAFEQAVRFYASESTEPVDEAMLRASYDESYRIAARDR